MAMNFEQFMVGVKENICDVLPEKYQGAAVIATRAEKINDSYMALCVLPKNERSSIAVNLEQAYQDYAAGDKDFKETLQDISGIFQHFGSPSLDMSVFGDYDSAKDKLFVRVCGAEQNQDLLERIPHRKVEDMALTYHIMESDNGDGIGSFLVTNQLLQSYGISQEQLHQDAMENSPKLLPPRIFSLFDVMLNKMREEMREAGVPEEIASKMIKKYQETEHKPLYGLTNERNIDGAGAIFYPDMMDKLGEMLGSDYFVLPSSTHEIVFMADDGHTSSEELKRLVSMMNFEYVEPEERLTNEAYRYDRENHIFEKVSSYEARMTEAEKAGVLAESEAPERPVASEKAETVERLEDLKKTEVLEQAPQRDQHDKAVRSKTETARASDSGKEKTGKGERKSVLKRLEQKKTEIKAREAGKEKVQGKRKETTLE